MKMEIRQLCMITFDREVKITRVRMKNKLYNKQELIYRGPITECVEEILSLSGNNKEAECREW